MMMTTNKTLSLALIAAMCSSMRVHAFAPTPGAVTRQTTALDLGIPKFFMPKEEEEDNQKQQQEDSASPKQEKKVGVKGLLQLITAGAGAPFLGDFEGVDEETGKFMFSLEANNLVDEEGNSKQTSMPYFESGWVDENDTGFQWPWEKKKDA